MPVAISPAPGSVPASFFLHPFSFYEDNTFSRFRQSPRMEESQRTAPLSLISILRRRFPLTEGGQACYNEHMEEKLSYRNTVRLFAGEKCFGPGVAQLLRHVQEFHSLRSAAKAMNMAYSKAWTIVKSSERILGVQLLHTSGGGKERRRSALTGGGGAPAGCLHCLLCRSARRRGRSLRPTLRVSGGPVVSSSSI